MFRIAALVLLLLFISCDYFQNDAAPEAIARVGDSYLYKEDIEELVPHGTSRTDSIVLVKNYIDRWASQKLLINAAEVNLRADEKAEFDALVGQYKTDLYTQAYLDELVKRAIDTVVADSELASYYKANRENFKTNSTLVRLRYINLKKDNPKYSLIRGKFFDYRKSDQKFWDTYALQFNSFAFNDSVWVDMGQIYDRLPFITPDNHDKFIVAGKQIEYPDSLSTYLVKITNVIGKNQVSPLQYIKPTLKEVILNKRKLALIRKFEKEITDDAIKENKYEIYK